MQDGASVVPEPKHDLYCLVAATADLLMPGIELKNTLCIQFAAALEAASEVDYEQCKPPYFKLVFDRRREIVASEVRRRLSRTCQ